MSGPIDQATVRRALSLVPVNELPRPRRAAVAVVLAVDDTGGPSLLLLRRTERAGDPWSGHMALPGGHAQADDVDLLHTARRETFEEVGLDLVQAELLGTLDDISPLRSSDIAVRPFVFWLDRVRDTSLSAEVAEVLWVPLSALAGDSLRATREVEVRGSTLRVPAFVIGGRVVWGMTFQLLERFLARVGVGT
jgi:8-oxo-dGTP pyrophosphatase MutT (NUDIX family)